MSDLLVSLEVGTHTVRALIADVSDDGEIHILGLGQCESHGIKKAEVIDPAAAQTCVQTALTIAEDQANIVANEVHLVYSCGGIGASLQHASVPVMFNGVISEDTVEDVKDNARAVSIPVEREIIHSVPQHFYVDGQPGVINPVGMVGSKLELDMLVLHGETTRMQNLVRVVNESRADILSAAFGGLCCGLAVLSEEQRKRGALVLDLGAGTTDFVSYSGGVPSYAGSIPVGGQHVTHDIAAGLNLSFEQAEEIKLKYASCTVDLAERAGSVTLDEDALKPRKVSLRDLNLITNARMEETLMIVRNRLAEHNILQRLSAGVFLTGGGTNMKDVLELAERVFKTRVQVGLPLNLTAGEEQLPSEAELPELATLVGMMQNVRLERRRKAPSGGGGFWPFGRRSA